MPVTCVFLQKGQLVQKGTSIDERDVLHTCNQNFIILSFSYSPDLNQNKNILYIIIIIILIPPKDSPEYYFLFSRAVVNSIAL